MKVSGVSLVQNVKTLNNNEGDIMGIRMSVARCCCGGDSGCTNVFCLYDDFSAYGNGNTVIGQPTSDISQWEQAFPAGGVNTEDAVAIQNASEQLELSSSVTTGPDVNHGCGIKRRWGVTDATDFISGYANATWFEFELVEMGTAAGDANPQVDFFAALLFEGDVAFRPGFNFSSRFSNNSTRFEIDFLYRDPYSIQTLRLDTSGWGDDTSFMNNTYKLEMYDGAYDGDGIFRWEWKVWVGGVVVAESMTGVSRNYYKLEYDNGTGWCENSGICFFNTVVGFKAQPTVTLDNIRFHVNNDTDCLPEEPEAPPA